MAFAQLSDNTREHQDSTAGTRKDIENHPERRTLSRHGSQDNIELSGSSEPKKAEIDLKSLDQMYMQQLDSMVNASKNKQENVTKTEPKLAKPSLNELKLKSQAEQMKKREKSIDQKSIDSPNSTVTNSSVVFPKSKTPSLTNQQKFEQSLTGLNLSALLQQVEMKEKRAKSKTISNAPNTTSKSEFLSQPHYHTIGSGVSHAVSYELQQSTKQQLAVNTISRSASENQNLKNYAEDITVASNASSVDDNTNIRTNTFSFDSVKNPPTSENPCCSRYPASCHHGVGSKQQTN